LIDFVFEANKFSNSANISFEKRELLVNLQCTKLIIASHI